MVKSKKTTFVITGIILIAILAANVFAVVSCFSGDITDPVVTAPADTLTTAAASETIQEQTETAEEQAAAGNVIGEGIGVNPGRVVWAYDPDSVDWDGSGYWWNINNFNQDIIQGMVDDSVSAFAGKDNTSQAWDAIFKYHNNRRGKGETGYKTGEKIAIKINMNGVNDSKGQTNMGFISPVTLKALLLSLVRSAGVLPSDITVYDTTRVIPDYMQNLCGTGELEGVNFKYNDVGGKNDCVPDKDFPIIWSESFKGETCYLPTCLTQAEYLINLASLKGHELAGVTLTAKNHFGTIMNSNRSSPPQAANIHGLVAANYYNGGSADWTWEAREMGSYSVLTDFIANKNIGGKTVLYLLDAFICVPTNGATVTGDMKWKSAPFNGDWTSSLFISQDPVAIDSVGVDFLMNEPSIVEYMDIFKKDTTLENYLIEAALADSPPSGVVYKDGAGNKVSSLGVHEHWNNANDKKYSRNLGKDYGIELTAIK